MNIISNAKNRNLEESIYFENHHIIPKCLGGSNKEINLVKLTPKEHFICHKLLMYFTKNEAKRKVSFAFTMMSSLQNKRKLSSRQYNEINKMKSLLMSKENNNFFGKQHSLESRKKMSIANKGKKLSDETKYKISKNHVGMLGKSHSEKTKKYLSDHNGRLKNWLIITPEKNFIKIFNLSKFCKENELNISALSMVAKGQRKHHKNYKALII